MYRIIYGICAGGKEVENISGVKAAYILCDFEVGYETKTGKFYLGIDTIPKFQCKKDEVTHLKKVLSSFQKWMLDKGLNTEKELNFADVFQIGMNIKTGFENLEDAYAALKFLVRGYCME